MPKTQQTNTDNKERFEMSAKTNRQWRLASRPQGMVKRSDFQWCEEPVSSISPNQVLVRNIYLSMDPAQRVWVRSEETMMPRVAIGELMRGITIGVVEESRHPGYQEGEIVQGLLGWQDFAVSDGSDLTKLPWDRSFPLTAFFGVFGHIGLSAYYGLLEIGKPQTGDTLVLSAAAGAVGSLVGQIGKIKGCRVVGLTGTDEKRQWLTDALDFDAAINYKTEPVLESLRRYCPNGIDIYFDMVGGEILAEALSLINMHARVVLCGMIANYTRDELLPGPSTLGNLIFKRARMEGFLVFDYMDPAHVQKAIPELVQWVTEGRLRYRVDVVDGLDKAPSALNTLFDGSNRGKLIVKISDEPTV
jgi:NADPH-dependent curcumin reductase CurA